MYMTSYQEALEIILESIVEPGWVDISTKESLGKVLAEDLFISRNFPDLRLSAVDGYAFRLGSDSSYKNVGSVAAGGQPGLSLEQGQCAAVMTGAPVPEGADCVVRIEQCEEEKERVRSTVPLQPGDLINEIGSEVKSGDLLVRRGTRISKSVYPSLFYAGIPRVKVYELPRVGMLLTGDELCDVDQTPAKGQVFNTNCYILESFMETLGLKINDQLQVMDDESAVAKALESLSESCDIVVSSGGVSMGRYDFVKKIFKEGRYQLLIQGTGIKPGRPLMVTRNDKDLFFGMPGYPAAFLTNCLVYLVPALKKACGRSDYNSRLISAVLETPLNVRKGRLDLNRIIITPDRGGWIARDAGSQKTSHFLNFSEVNGLAFLDEETGSAKQGDVIKCLHFDLELC